MSVFPVTLRLRLALWYAASLVAVIAVFGFIVYGLVRYQLYRHHDGSLREAAAAVARVLSEHEDCESLTAEQTSALDSVGHLVLFHEVDGSRRVFYRSPDAAAADLPVDANSALGSAEQPRFDTIQEDHELLRMYSVPYVARSGRRGVIHVMHRLGDVPAPLASLRGALLLMAPLGALFAALGGYWLAARALAPVDQVTRLAQAIEATSLSQRLPSPKVQDEIGRLVGTLNLMIGRLEGSFESMRRFTADASHELRGPLATMRAAIDVALSRPRDADAYRGALTSVGEDVDRLRSIAEDLLVLARADAGRIVLRRQPVRLDVIAEEVTESLQPLAAERGVVLGMREQQPLTVLGDERWLRQLIFNLVDNGLRFSSRGISGQAASVTVDVQEGAGAARLLVADSGPGIPEGAQTKIFERFYRSDDARTFQEHQGAGLGLAIALWIAEAHEGCIAAENRPEGGSLFSVELPLAGEA